MFLFYNAKSLSNYSRLGIKVGPVYGESHNWAFFQVVSNLVHSTLSKNRELLLSWKCAL